jgi:HEAT repeat protein
MNTATPARLEPSLQALKTYEAGSSRGDLMPIDEEVRTSLDDPIHRSTLESQLLGALDTASILGQVYLLKQIALIGSSRAVAKVADRLSQTELTDPACRALEALPCPEAAGALRDRLPQLKGNARLGVVHVLGRKRDRESVRLLTGLLSNKDTSTAGAAAGALGRIGSPEAGHALTSHLSKAPTTQRASFAHAARDCADRLAQAGQAEAANALLKALG